VNEGEPRLARTLRTGDGLAVVVGIMVGSGIFRTPGTVAALLGRPGLTFVAWALGGAVGFLGAYTTFSTFSFESLALIQNGYWLLALLNMIGSVGLGLGATLCGVALARLF